MVSSNEQIVNVWLLMSHYCSRGRWVVWLSCLLALILQMMPWPSQIYILRPSWLQLVLIYWAMALPHRVNVGTAFTFGLVWDLSLGSVLGIRSTALSVQVYLVAFKSQLLRNMALWQQALVVMLLSLMSSMLIFVLESVAHRAFFQIDTFWPSIINAVLWPWIFLLLRKIRRKFGVQ